MFDKTSTMYDEKFSFRGLFQITLNLI